MNADKFRAIYNESRNGANGFYRHWAARSFRFSDGVKDLADEGCHWLIDIVATEVPHAMRKAEVQRCILNVRVKSRKAQLELTAEDDAPPLWKKSIGYTDMPEGDWVFEVVDEGGNVAMILITEH